MNAVIDMPFLARHFASQDNPVAAAVAVNAAHPVGRYAAAAEVAETTLFLASEAESFVTGAILAVDGGYIAR